MVVLGFRPKGSAPPQKENQVPVVKTEVKKIEAEVKMEKKPIKPTDKPAKKQVPHKAKIMKRPVNVSSNWQKLKSLNTLKVAPGTTHLAEEPADHFVWHFVAEFQEQFVGQVFEHRAEYFQTVQTKD